MSDTGTSGLKRHTIRGFAYLGGQAVVSKIATTASQFVLSWLLLPEDFGLVSLAYTVTGFAGALSQIGLREFLINRRRSELWAESAVWAGTAVTTCNAGLMLLLAPLAAAFYEEPRIIPLIFILALAHPFSAFNTIQFALLQKQFRFGQLTVISTLVVILAALLSMGLAAVGFGVYSFVVPGPASSVLLSVLLWRTSGFRIRFRPRPQLWRYFVRTSTLVLLTNVVWTLRAQGDYMVLGVLKSTTEVGLYFFAYSFATQFNRFLAGGFGGILFPVLSHMGDDDRRLADAFHRAVGITAVLVVPLCILQAAIVGPVIRLFFADRWIAAIPLLQMLSIGLGLHTIASPCGALQQAQGRYADVLKFAVMWLVLLLPTVFIAATWGDLQTVAASVMGLYALVSPVYFYLVTRRLGLTFYAVLKLYLPSSAVSLAAAAVAVGIVHLFKLNDIAALCVTLLLYPLVYIAAISRVSPEEWREASGLLLAQWRRVRGRGEAQSR